MTEAQRSAVVAAAIQGALPVALASAGLSDFEDYVTKPPNDPKRSQFAVWHAEGGNAIASESISLQMRAQLPRVDDPKDYLSVIWQTLQTTVRPELVQMTDREMAYATWYPGDLPRSGSSSLIDIEVEFSRELDDKE